jgi:Derlin-2/3
MDTNSPEAWFKNLPPVTRSLLVALFTTTALFSMGLMDVNLILLDWSLVTKKYV